jgi:uncharacterized metal-binding protein
VFTFPFIDIDTRAFEALGWQSYPEGNMFIGRGAYSSYIINPIYRVLNVRATIVFGSMNIFFHVLINLNLLEIIKNYIRSKKALNRRMMIFILSPLTLIIRAGVLREAIIIYFIYLSVKYFVLGIKNKQRSKNKIILSFDFGGVATLFHSGVVFVIVGYLFYLMNEKKNKFANIVFVVLGAGVILKDFLLSKFGGGDLDAIVR